MKRYRIYAMKPTGENIYRASEKYRFFRATPQYLLVYTEKKKPQESTLVKDTSSLNLVDQSWIQSCNLIIADETLKKSPSAQEKMSDFLKVLEQEIEKEKELLKGEAASG